MARALRETLRRGRARALPALLAALSLGLLLSQPAAAATEGEEIVSDARFAAERLLADKDLPQLRRYVENAKAVFIVPSLVKGSFIVGAEGGTGVVLVRGADGSWSPPAFYTLAAGSVGLQIGGQVSEVIFTIMTDGAVEAFLGNEFKLGGDLSVAVGPIGAGLEASTTTNLADDIYAFAKSVGLFGGGALEGAKIFSRGSLNDEYYNAYAPTRDILINRKFFNPQADQLRSALP